MQRTSFCSTSTERAPHDAAAARAPAPLREASRSVALGIDGVGTDVVTIFVHDLDAYVAAIAAHGLKPDQRETYSNGVRKVLYRDPGGNELGFGGASLDSAR